MEITFLVEHDSPPHLFHKVTLVSTSGKASFKMANHFFFSHIRDTFLISLSPTSCTPFIQGDIPISSPLLPLPLGLHSLKGDISWLVFTPFSPSHTPALSMQASTLFTHLLTPSSYTHTHTHTGLHPSRFGPVLLVSSTQWSSQPNLVTLWVLQRDLYCWIKSHF